MKLKLTIIILTLSLAALPGCTLIVSSQPLAEGGPSLALTVVQGGGAEPVVYALDAPTQTIQAPTPADLPPTTTTTTAVASASHPGNDIVPRPTQAPVDEATRRAQRASTPTLAPAGTLDTAALNRAALTPTHLPTSTPALSPTTGQPTPTPTPTATATPLIPPPTSPPAPTPTATPALTSPTPTTIVEQTDLDGPQAYETSIVIDTFDYQSAFVPTTAEDSVYPYPRLSHELVGPAVPKEYKAVVLENRYTRLVMLPELGGRLYQWIDKPSGKNLFYQNPVIKPTGWGNRGWWLATGGMEWALPTDEHGLSEASPWSYTIQQGSGVTSVTLKDTEERSGLVSEINVALDADHSYFTLTPIISNPTETTVNYKFWINGMFGLGEQSAGPGIEFVLPGNHVTVHSTGDSELPGEYEQMDWPVHKGRVLSDYGEWRSYLGVFAAPSALAGYAGAYNHNTNLGVVRVFPHQIARGVKVFGPGDLDPANWTIDESSYFELWGGLAPTFRDEATLPAGQSVNWQERWYAVGDMGGFSYANEAAALNLGTTGASIQVAAASTRYMNGYLVLWGAGKEVTRWPLALAPERAFRGSYEPPGGSDGTWGLSLFDEAGREIAGVGSRGDLVEGLPADPTPEPSVVPPGETPGAGEVLVIDRNGQQRDWEWVEQEFGYELQRAPYRAPDGRVFRLVKLTESDSGPVYVVEVRDENGQALDDYWAAQYWPDAPNDISQIANQEWHGFTRAAYGFPDSNGNWGVSFGPEGIQSPGEGECAFFVLSEKVPGDVLARVGPLPGTNYRVLRPTFTLVQEESGGASLPSPTSTPLPVEAPQPVLPPGTPGLVWDERLDLLDITLERATPERGKPTFRLVAARFRDEAEAEWLHHIYVEVLDEGGRRLLGQPVVMAWENGQSTMITEDKPPPQYAANAPMYGYLGEYWVYVGDGISDTVNGLGLPGKRHVSYYLTFQRVKD